MKLKIVGIAGNSKVKLFKAGHSSQISVNKFLTAFLVIFSLNGCQLIQKPAQDLRSTIDQTIQSSKDKADAVKNSINQTTDQAKQSLDQVKQQIDSTKTSVDHKMQDIQAAGQKINDAQKALYEANQAVDKISK